MVSVHLGRSAGRCLAEVKGSREEDDEGHHFDGDEGHRVVQGRGFGFVEVCEVLENVTNHEQGDDFELFPNGV